MIGRDLALIVGAFVAATLIALALGATNLGTALTFGTMALVGTIFVLMLRGRD